MNALTPWKRPPRRKYAPKPLDAGQPVSWTARHPGYWEDAPGVYPAGRRRVQGEEYTRTGAVWSAGPSPNTWFVIPDGERSAVLVSRLCRDDYLLAEESQYPAGYWARANRAMLRITSASIYAVAERAVETSDWNMGRREKDLYVGWHADPGCPRAAGKERVSSLDGLCGRGGKYRYVHGWCGPGRGPWNPSDVARAVTGQVAFAGDPFCRVCVWQDAPAEIAA